MSIKLVKNDRGVKWEAQPIKRVREIRCLDDGWFSLLIGNGWSLQILTLSVLNVWAFSVNDVGVWNFNLIRYKVKLSEKYNVEIFKNEICQLFLNYESLLHLCFEFNLRMPSLLLKCSFISAIDCGWLLNIWNEQKSPVVSNHVIVVAN